MKPILKSTALHLVIGLGIVFLVVRARPITSAIEENSTPFSVQSLSAQKSLQHSPEKSPKESLMNEQRSSLNIEKTANIGENHEQFSYAQRLRSVIAQHQTYPLLARKRHLEGEVIVQIELNAHGEMIREPIVISQNSAEISPLLIDAALKSVQDSAPFAIPPPGISLVFQIPIQFRIDSN